MAVHGDKAQVSTSKRKRKREINSSRRRRKHDRRDPRLPIQPFSEWLRRKVVQLNYANVARLADVSPRRVRFLCHEESSQGGKTYKVCHVRLSTVERFTSALEEHPYAIYHPAMVEKYNAFFHDARRREKSGAKRLKHSDGVDPSKILR